MNYNMSMSTPGAAPPDMGIEPLDLADTALTSLAVADALGGMNDNLGRVNSEVLMPEL
jgi:hypothetical protein